MATFKCKMCGGALEIKEKQTTVVCEYCGTRQTLPKLDDEKRANLYDRANHFRRNNEYDKAISIYEKILNEDNSDAEAYWSLVLCRYGIEYVEDPATHKRVPTVNRAQFTAIYDDEDYKSALQYADEYQKKIYEEEADAINKIQRGILEISQKEEPFDVFICYKETDESGRRTQDSVLANDLYHQLTQEGFRVFFSRITLEDKLGSAYEPYIFAALNSAKVMVVIGTKPEYFNAVWVKNEWSRYLALIKNGAQKMLIPAYRDMDPYDLPEEFSHLQAQDMSKLGFMQDLIRGIKKITQADEPSAATVVKKTVVTNGGSNAAPLLERAFMFLQDGDWKSADEYCEKVLDIEPKNAQAYLGKLMAELRVKRQKDLKNCAEPFDSNNNFQKVMQFGDKTLADELKGYIAHIKERNETARQERIYQGAKELMGNAFTEDDFKSAMQAFRSVSGYKDAEEQAKVCLEKADTARKDAILNEAKRQMGSMVVANVESAIRLFESIPGWKDSQEKIEEGKRKIAELKAEAEADRIERERQEELARREAARIAKRNKKVAMISTPILVVVIAFLIVLNTVILPTQKKNAFIATYGQAAYDTYGVVEKDAYISFGAYEQDNDTSNGKEAIEWRVLEVTDGKALLISKYALDCKPYNIKKSDVTWETCTLRNWLNNDFINAAFSEDEKALIPTVTVSADANPGYSTNPGNVTQDKVFLLSILEAEKYFASDNVRQCKPTAYAEACGAFVGSNNETCCWWWLRSPGIVQYGAAFAHGTGAVYGNGYAVDYENYAVRPALWIDLNNYNN